MSKQHETSPKHRLGLFPSRVSYVRVKTSSEGGTALDPGEVFGDLGSGVTNQMRVYRSDPSGPLELDYQVAADNVTLPPLIPDRSPAEDPIHFAYIGTITVNLPDGTTKRLCVTAHHEGAVSIDLAQGVRFKTTFTPGAASPIGPLFDLEIAPVARSPRQRS